MTNRPWRFGALLATLLTAFALFPLLQPRFFATSDGLYHLYRLMEYDSVLKQGIWYPRWAPDFFYGFGMPLFNYYAPLTYYLAEVFHIAGAGYLDSFRLLAAVSTGLSGLGAYLYARQLLPALPAVLASVVYVYAPYHLLNLYYRGDLPEYVAYVWLPFILWSTHRILSTGRPRFVIAGALFYAALILTHNLSAFLFSGFLAIYVAAALLRSAAQRERFKTMLGGALRLAGMAALACGLTAFFWLPAIFEKHLIQLDRLLIHYNFRDAFPKAVDFFSTDLIHRYGVIFRATETYAYQLGLSQAVFLALGLVVLVWQARRLAPLLRIELVASSLVALLALFLIFPPSQWFWENVPLLSLTQFPWRLLAFVALPVSLFAGLLPARLPARFHAAAATALIAGVILSSVAGLSPIWSDVREDDISPRGSLAFELAYGPIGTSAAAEYLPAAVKERPATSPAALAAALGEARATFLAGNRDLQWTEVERRANQVTYSLRAAKETHFVSDVLSFPGWTASLDGRQADAGTDDPTGMVEVYVPAGDHTLVLRFVETRLRSAADLLSLAVALLLIIAIVVRRPPRALISRPGLSVFARSLAAERTKIAALVTICLLLLVANLGYDLQHRARSSLDVTFAGQVVVAGYEMSGPLPDAGSMVRTAAGAPIDLKLFWRTEQPVPPPYTVFARLTNHFDQIWAYAESSDQATAVGTDNVTALSLVPPPGTPPGVYLVEVGVASPDGPLEMTRVRSAPLMPRDRAAPIGPVLIERTPSAEPALKLAGGGATALSQPVNFENQFTLLDLALGLDIHTGRIGPRLAQNVSRAGWQVRAGESIHIDLLWLAEQQQDINWTVTSRLVGADGKLWTVRDSQPADGLYPTTFWRPNEVVRDQLSLSLPPEMAPGDYTLEIQLVAPGRALTILDQNGNPLGPVLRVGTITVGVAPAPAGVASVAVQNRVSMRLLEGLAIRGYSLGRRELQPGDALDVDILWEGTRQLEKNVVAKLEMVDAAGGVWASDSHGPAGDAYPTNRWRQREVLKGRFTLTSRPSTPAGDLSVVVELADRSTGVPIAAARQTLDTIRVTARPRAPATEPSRALERVFGGKMRLLGFDLSNGAPLRDDFPAVDKSRPLQVTLHWQAIAEMATSYTVFAQLLDLMGRLVAQHDSPPQVGKLPTTGWAKEEKVDDTHTIAFPPALQPGDYTVIVGVYDAASGKRLPVAGGEDFVPLSRIRLAGN